MDGRILLKKTLHNSLLTRAELEVILHEVEFVINSRPLTFVSDGLNDPKPLTPMHFITGKSVGSSIDTALDGFEGNTSDILEAYSATQGTLRVFWKRWSKEYLRNLPPVISKTRHPRDLQVGDLVLIKDDNSPRMQWPLALIKNIYPGPDNIVRSVDVKTSTGIIKRSIQGLHNLEASFFEKNTYRKNLPKENSTQTTFENHVISDNNSRSDENLLPDPSDPEDDAEPDQQDCAEPEPQDCAEPQLEHCAEPDPEVLEDIPAGSAPVVVPDDVATIEPLNESRQGQRVSSCTTTRVGRKVRPRKILDL